MRSVGSGRVADRGQGLHAQRRRCSARHRAELQQHPVAQALHHPSSMRGQHLGAHLMNKTPPAVDEAVLVFLHQPHRFDDVNHDDGAPRPRQFG
jgi:hypothetical protein